jgi:cysteine desulfurase/selenocysteine lyase
MTAGFDIKHDFGVFDHIPDLAYFDSASTTLVPRQAVSTTCNFLDSIVASARRGAHRLAVKGGAIVENTRTSLATFLETDRSQISFQKSIPSAVASFVYGFDWKTAGKNKIVIAQSEENSILVSLLQSAKVLGLDVELASIDEKGKLSLDELEKKVDEKTGLVAVSHVTTGPGVRNPVQSIAKISHEYNAILLTDATRSAGLTSETITTLGADILVMSANIGLMGPPGLAIQWIDKALGETHKPGILGGSSVTNVIDGSFEIALQPDRYEPGYLNVPAIAGLETSLEYLTKLHSQGLVKHINKLSKHLLRRLKEIDGLIVYGEPDEKSTTFGLNLNPEDGINCHDVALFLDESNIAVRSGVLCTHPLIQTIADDGIIQASIHAYNTLEDINRLTNTISVIASELL